MRFIDASASYGHLRRNAVNAVTAVSQLVDDMSHAGVEKAVVFHHLQDVSAPMGNKTLARDIKRYDNLFGVWSMLPTATRETPPPDQLPALMKDARIVGLRFNPTQQHFPWPRAVAGYLEMAVHYRIPVFVNTGYDLQEEEVFTMLTAYPELVTVLGVSDFWPGERRMRPLLESFPHVYLSLTNQFTQFGIESLVDFCGSKRLLYGSDYPNAYMGAHMMNLLRAGIDDADKKNIAFQNMERVWSKVKL